MMLRNIQKAGPPVARVLSICDDDGLRLSRELLLLKDGYKTESIQSHTALTVTRVRSFDFALICRSVDPKRSIALIEMLRRYHPAIQILCIAPLESSAHIYLGDLEVPSGPQALLDAIRILLQKRQGFAERSAVLRKPCDPFRQPGSDRDPPSTNRVDLAVDQALEEAAARSGAAACTMRPLLLNSKPSNSADFFTRVKGPSSAAKK
jgi:hypothetical protein